MSWQSQTWSCFFIFLSCDFCFESFVAFWFFYTRVLYEIGAVSPLLWQLLRKSIKTLIG